MKTFKPQVLFITAILVAFALAFWAALLVLDYVDDDWTSPPADSRSVPATRTY